jgi:hypothetical protein
MAFKTVSVPAALTHDGTDHFLVVNEDTDDQNSYHAICEAAAAGTADVIRDALNTAGPNL